LDSRSLWRSRALHNTYRDRVNRAPKIHMAPTRSVLVVNQLDAPPMYVQREFFFFGWGMVVVVS
jgi:hypothetical protein